MDRSLAVWVGLPMVASALVGAFASDAVDPVVLELVFAILATAAAAAMLLLGDGRGRDGSVGFSRRLAALIGTVVGVMAGMLGAGGAFMVIPLMVHVLGIPIRSAIGTSLVMVLGSAIASIIGKLATGQIAWHLAVGLAVGALPGGRLGAAISIQTQPRRLALLLGMVMALVAVRVWIDVVGALTGAGRT